MLPRRVMIAGQANVALGVDFGLEELRFVVVVRPLGDPHDDACRPQDLARPCSAAASPVREGPPAVGRIPDDDLPRRKVDRVGETLQPDGRIIGRRGDAAGPDRKDESQPHAEPRGAFGLVVLAHAASRDSTDVMGSDGLPWPSRDLPSLMLLFAAPRRVRERTPADRRDVEIQGVSPLVRQESGDGQERGSSSRDESDGTIVGESSRYRPFSQDRQRRGRSFRWRVPRLFGKILGGELTVWFGLIAWSAISPGGPMPTPKANASAIRVLSWNILYGVEAGPPWRCRGWPVAQAGPE